MKKFLQQSYRPAVVVIMIIAMWLIFSNSDFIALQNITAPTNPIYWTIKFQTLLMAEALTLISGLLLLWLGRKDKK